MKAFSTTLYLYTLQDLSHRWRKSPGEGSKGVGIKTNPWTPLRSSDVLAFFHVLCFSCCRGIAPCLESSFILLSLTKSSRSLTDLSPHSAREGFVISAIQNQPPVRYYLSQSVKYIPYLWKIMYGIV